VSAPLRLRRFSVKLSLIGPRRSQILKPQPGSDDNTCSMEWPLIMSFTFVMALFAFRFHDKH
jgi:hypothetical protein